MDLKPWRYVIDILQVFDIISATSLGRGGVGSKKILYFVFEISIIVNIINIFDVSSI